MPKYQIDTDQGKFELETDSPVTSNEQMQQLVQTQLGGGSPDTTLGSKVESGLRGAVQGATMGWGDELEAGISALTQKGLSTKDAYEHMLPIIREKYKASEAANPKTYGISEAVGSLAPLAVAPEVSAPVALGTMGATSALGHSESRDPLELAKQATIGGATGAVLGKGGELLGKGVEALGTGVSRGMESLAPKAENLANDIVNKGAPKELSSLLESTTETAAPGASLKNISSTLSPDSLKVASQEGMKATVDESLKSGHLAGMLENLGDKALGYMAGSAIGHPFLGLLTLGPIFGKLTKGTIDPQVEAVSAKLGPILVDGLKKAATKLPQWSQTLQLAAKQGGNALPAALYALSNTDDDFRKIYMEFQDKIREDEQRSK